MGRDFSVIATLFFKASSLQKKRAILTVAAIAWGTVAILMLLAFGEGLKNQMVKARRGMDRRLVVGGNVEGVAGSSRRAADPCPTR